MSDFYSSADQLKIDYADLGVSVGYIGNVDRWGDSREYRIFTKLNDGTTDCCNVSLSRGTAAAHAEAGTAPQWDTQTVRRWLDDKRQKVADNKLFLVEAFRWLERAKADAALGKVPATYY